MAQKLEYRLTADTQQAIKNCEQLLDELNSISVSAVAAGGALSYVGDGGNDVATAVANIDSDGIKDVASEAGKAADRVEQIGKSGKESASALTKLGSRGVSALKSVGKGILDAVGGFAKYAAMAGIAAAATAGIATIKFGADLEQTRLQLQVMLGDVEKGNALLKEINTFANVTPFSNDEVVKAGKVLLSYGMSVSEIRSTLKSAGDVSAATGKDFEELSAIIGKVYAKGVADSEALNQMSEAGIPIVRELGDMYGVTARQVYDMASKSELSSSIVLAAFQRMTSQGGMFFDMMDKQSRTLKGAWSTFTGQMQYAAAVVGEQLVPLFTEGTNSANSFAAELVAAAESGQLLEDVVAVLDVLLGLLGGATSGAIILGTALVEGGKNFYSVLRALGELLSVVIYGALTSIAAVVETIVAGAIEAYNALARLSNWEEVEYEPYKYTKMFGQATADEGRDFYGLAQGVGERFAASAETMQDAQELADKISGKIDDFRAKLRETAKAAKEAAKNSPQPDLAGDETGAVSTMEPPAQPKETLTISNVDVDDLASKGLYNWGRSGDRLESEKLTLIKRIVRILEGGDSAEPVMEA